MSVSIIDSAMLSTYMGGNIIDSSLSDSLSRCVTKERFATILVHLPDNVKSVIWSTRNYTVMGATPDGHIWAKNIGQDRVVLIYPSSILDDKEGTTVGVYKFYGVAGEKLGPVQPRWQGGFEFLFKKGKCLDRDWKWYTRHGVELSDEVVNRIAMDCLQEALTRSNPDWNQRKLATKLAMATLLSEEKISRDQVHVETLA